MTQLPQTGAKLGSVLVLEDEAFTKRMYELTLTKAGYEVHAAQSVEEAKALVSRVSAAELNCVISDYSLGDATGIDFLHWIKQIDGSLAVILITAGTQKHLVEESLRGGACDFLNKPAGGAALVDSVRRACDKTTQQRRLLESQHAVERVGEVQRRMLGVLNHTPRIRTEVCFSPKYEAGGDFISQYRQGSHLFHFMTTDVSGHDLNAAFVSAYFQGMVRGMMEREASIPDIFKSFNRYLCLEWNSGNPSESITSLAASCVSIDFERNEAVALTCGNPPPVYVDGTGRVQILDRGNGSPPLGWFEETSIDSVKCSIAVGGAFFSWSDGLSDMASSMGVSSLSLASAILLAQRAGLKHPALSSAYDDVMLARLELRAADVQPPRFLPLLADTLPSGGLDQIDAWQEVWRKSLLTVLPEMVDELLYNILLCIREAVINGIKHGCANGGSAFLQVVLNQDTSVLTATVLDPGPGHGFDVDVRQSSDPENQIEFHRGLVFMKHLASSIRQERRGATIHLDFQLSCPPASR